MNKDREAFESCITMPDDVAFVNLYDEYLENGMPTDVSRGIQLAWEIWEIQQNYIDAQQARIDELEARCDEAELLLNGVAFMFMANGYAAKKDSNNSIEIWMHEFNEWKDGAE